MQIQHPVILRYFIFFRFVFCVHLLMITCMCQSSQHMLKEEGSFPALYPYATLDRTDLCNRVSARGKRI